MVNKLTILAVLVVTLSVASTVYGLPAAQTTDREELAAETTTAKGGVRGWIKGVYDKIRRPSEGCGHAHHEDGHGGRGVFHWVKSKLGYVKPTTVAPTTTTTVVTTAATDSRDDGVDDQRPDVGSPEAGTPDRPAETGDDLRPETGDEGASPPDAENDRPETEGVDESVGDDATQQPADVTENNINEFAGEDLTPQGTVTFDPRIDARISPQKETVREIKK